MFKFLKGYQMKKKHFNKENSKSNQTTGKDIYLYGKHPVSLALENKRRIIKEVLLLATAQDKIKIPKNIPFKFVTKEQIEAHVGKEAVHQGIIARCAPLAPLDTLDIIAEANQKEKDLIVILDQVTDPHNIGAIMRSAAAFNASAVLIPQNGAPDETGVLAKSASGALELIPLIKVKNLSRAMDELKEAGFWCIGLDGYAKHSIYQTKLPKKAVIVMGSEGDGLRRLTAEKCDDTVKLPMNPKVESLNVSNACAVTLYEWNRQHLSGE